MPVEKALIISAHVGDFVWRSAGTIAKYTKLGVQVDVIVLTYGARGESGAYYKKLSGTVEECKVVRRAEAEKASEILGINSIAFCDYDDFPLEMDLKRLESLAERIRRIAPTFIITHDKGKDWINPDHTKTAEAVLKAQAIACARGVYLNGAPALPHKVPVFGFEPMSTEACDYNPDIYVDITEDWDMKMAAMECLETQRGSMDAYVQKAILRASYCSGRGGRPGCKYAESFSMYAPVCSHEGFVW